MSNPVLGSRGNVGSMVGAGVVGLATLAIAGVLFGAVPVAMAAETCGGQWEPCCDVRPRCALGLLCLEESGSCERMHSTFTLRTWMAKDSAFKLRWVSTY